MPDSSQILVFDRELDELELVSVRSDGTMGELDMLSSITLNPVINFDGSTILFRSRASLVEGDTNADYDLFVRNRGGSNRISQVVETFAGEVISDIDFGNNILRTSPGDANLDGVFDSADLVQIFIGGEYEDGTPGNSGWSTGDWDGDGEFTSSDLVQAFGSGSYVSAVEEAVSLRQACLIALA